ncbi:MAG: FAD/NAD(P)-binding protein [Candidatus Latescibacteria bacterium]|nr:FAD/NAD(P)-binding protein [Candidatus Latescibacterota bacterium]
MTQAPYMPIPAKIEAIVEETPNIKTFTVRPEQPIPFQAGQFMELTVPGLGEAPFTPSSSPAVSDHMEITIMRVGKVTECLHSLSPGAQVGIRGPLGQPYPLQDFHGREVLIVGGGVGLAPLRALLFALFEEMDRYKKIIVRYGARTPSDLVYRDALSEAWGKGDALDLRVTVDKGDETWSGHEGVVTTILEEAKLTSDVQNGVAVVCGPPIMMRFATLSLLELGYAKKNIYLSMEKNMSCGVGKCGHCRLGPYYACKDGPVFSYDKIESLPKIWD